MITVQWAEGHGRFPQVEFRRLFQSIKRPVPPAAEMVTAYTDGTVTLRSNRRLDGYHEATDMSGMQGVRVGDFVIHGLDILRGSVGISDSEGALSSVCIVCKPIGKADPRYFAWVIRAQAATGFPRALARGIREGGADFRRWGTLAELPVPCPPLAQQRAIADYLDTETGRIDALISKKRHMIRLLRERWIAHSESVLSRFEPLPLKRHVTKIGSGSTPRGGAEVYVPSGPAFLRSQNIRDGVIDLSDVVFIDRLAQEQLRRALVRPGDVLLNITGGSIGRAAVMDRSDIRAYVSQHVCIVRPVPAVDAWVLWAELSSQSVQEQIAITQAGGNREGLNFEQVGNLRIRVPPIDQSQAISQELSTSFRGTERTTETLRSQIELLGERRQALVTSAVTGELLVPGMAA